MRKLLLNPTPLFRKLRQLSLLLSLLLVPQLAGAADYLTIAGIQVTDANASNITGDGITAGTVTFNPSNNTLTLDNARVNGTVSTTLETLNVHLKGHSIFNVTTDGTNNFYLFNGATNLYYSAENFGDVLEGIGTTDDYKLCVSNVTGSYDGSVVFWKNFYTNINSKCYCKLSKPYLFVGDNEEVDKSNYNSDTRFSFDAANSSLTFSETPNSSNNNAFLVKSNIANLTVNITDNIIYGLDNNTNTGKAFIYTGNDNSSTLTLNIAEGKTLKVQWSNTSTGNKDWINQGFSNTNISYDLSTMGSSDVYGEEVQASLLYSIIFSNVEKYGLTIAGTPVTSTNASSITGTGISGTISFDATNNILTLNTATLAPTSETYGILSSLNNLTIHLTGTNSISGTNMLEGIKSNNNGTLTFTADASATLAITTTGDAASAVTGFSNVTMGTGAYLQTDIPTKYDTNGKNFCWQVSSANIIKELVITSAPCYPLWIGNTQFTSTSTPTGFSFDATNNILTLTNVTQANPLISGLANLTIALSGDNSITKSDSSAVIRSINSQAALIIQKAGTGDGSLYLENNGSDPSASPVVKNFASINHTGLNYSSKSGSSINGASTHDAILSSATIYPLWIAASKPVTASTTSGTGWSYDAANNKLSLNNATINGSIISGLGDLTIDIQGTNTISVSDTASVIRSTSAGKLTITKTGTTTSLQLNNTRQSSYHSPIIKDFASFELAEGLYLSNAKAYGTEEVPAVYEAFTNVSQNGGNSTMGLITPTLLSNGDKGIRNITISTNEYYPIWVAHHRASVGNGYNVVYTQISPTNKDDFLGDVVPRVSFIPASTGNGNVNTLVLNGAAITDAIISNLANLTIEFSGTNSLCENGKTAGYIHSSNPNAIITFKSVADNSSISLECANDYAVVEGFANVAFDKAVAEYNNGEYFYYDQTNKRYKNNSGDLTLLTIKAPTSPTMGYNDQEKVTLSKPYPDGDIYYTITYADGKTTDVAKTKYTAEFALDAPGTVEAWVEANGATTSSVKGKHFGYQEAQFSLLEQEELTPVLIPAIETGDNIDYATAATRYAIDDANVATIDNNGKITALAIGTARLTTQLAYASNLPLTTTILNYDKKFTTQLTVSKVFNIAFAEGENYMTYYNIDAEDLTIPDGMTAAIVTGVASSGTTVETTALSYIPGRTAILLGKGTSTGTPSVTKYIGKDPAPTGNKLKYVDNTPVATTGYEYILYKDEFVKATGSIPDGKCYLDLTGAAPAPARSLGIDSDGTTDIHLVNSEEGIANREVWYDLQGRRIEQPTKAGLYIKNGKKVIVNTK